MRLLSRLVLVSLVVGVVGAAGFAAARWMADDGGWSLAENRVWIERMPRSPRDMTKKLCFIHEEDQREGVVVRSSEYRLFLDVFHWQRADDGRVRMTFPQVEKQRQAAVRAWRCTGEAPAPFELCLEVKEGDRRLVLYSMEDWVIGSAGELATAHAPWNSAHVDGPPDNGAAARADEDDAADAALDRSGDADDDDATYPGF